MIISCLLTRRCNLTCSYCRLIKEYEDYPEAYPKIKDFYQLEKQVTVESWQKLGLFFKSKDPGVLMLLYGGEPTLYPYLDDLIEFYNKHDVFYSIITNAVKKDWVLERVHNIRGLTCSVDPNVTEKHRKKKSDLGLELLKEAKSKNPNLDCVAEVVLDKENYMYLEDLVSIAKDIKIRLSVTIIEKPENKYYDFADLSSEKLLLNKKECKKVLEVIEKYENSGIILNLWAIKEVLQKGSQNLRCDYTREMFYVVDSDFKPRLCLRIRGVEVPKINLSKYVEQNDYKSFYEEYCKKAEIDFKLYCEGCSWTCAVMGEPSFQG